MAVKYKTRAKKPFQSPGHYTQADRQRIPLADFGDPQQRKFPIVTQSDLDDAARLIGKAAHPAAVKSRLLAIAKRKGLTPPAAWQATEGDRAAMPEDTSTEAPDLTNLSLPDIARETESMYRAALEALGTPDALEKIAALDLLTRTSADEEDEDEDTSEDEDDEDDGGNDEGEDEDEEPPPSRKARRAEAPTLTRAAEVVQFAPPPAADVRFYVPLVRTDPDKREIEGVLSTEEVDTFGTIFDYPSMKRAVQTRWNGNVREQHDPKKAVGKGVLAICDDDQRQVVVRARISKGAEDTWQKILDGTLSGFSIGAANAKTETRMVGTKQVPVYKDFDLAEISVVDAPSNPGAQRSGLTIYRSALPDAPEFYADALEADATPSDTPATEAAPASVTAETLAVAPAAEDHATPLARMEQPLVSPVEALQADPAETTPLGRVFAATQTRSEDLMSGQPNLTSSPSLDHSAIEDAMNGESGYVHVHSHPYDETTVHTNDHEHEHTDGAKHKHPHTHGHVGSGDGSRPHVHLHEHDHQYRTMASDLVRAADSSYHLREDSFIGEDDPRIAAYLRMAGITVNAEAPAVLERTQAPQTNGSAAEFDAAMDILTSGQPLVEQAQAERSMRDQTGVQTPDETRYGMRISGETRTGMHEAALAILRTCGCPTCQDAIHCFDPDNDGDDDVDAQYGGDTDGDAVPVMPRAQRAELRRAVGTIVQTQVGHHLAPALSQMRAIAARLATVSPSTQTPDLTRVMDSVSELRAALATVAAEVHQMAEQEVPGGPVLRATAATLAPDKQLAYRSAGTAEQFNQQDLAALAKMAQRGVLSPQDQTRLAAALITQQHS